MSNVRRRNSKYTGNVFAQKRLRGGKPVVCCSGGLAGGNGGMDTMYESIR